MQFVSTPVKSDFLCKLCNQPWDPEAAVQCADCEAPFCRLCYDESMMKEALCQSCNKQPATFVPIHRLVRSMAESLEVFCTFKSHGCDWTGARKALEPHAATCAKRPKELTYVNEGAVPPELICPICSNPFVDPVQLPCEHVFCRTCITESLKRQPMCPHDRLNASVDNFSAPPKVINELLDELPVYCAQRNAEPNSCAWTGRRRDYAGHKTVCKGGQGPAPLKPAPAATSDKMQIEAITEYPSIEAGNVTQEIYAMAHLTAPKLDNLEQRKKPLSISAVIDVSGSMSGGKLNMAKESLRFMIDEMTERDYLGIVTFGSDIGETIPSLPMTAENKKRAHLHVTAIETNGRTYLSGGLFAGMAQAHSGIVHQPKIATPFIEVKPVPVNKRPVRRPPVPQPIPETQAPATQVAPPPADSCKAVLLFTDGEANVGITTEAELVPALRNHQLAKDTVVHTFGFGADHNARMLQQVAEAGAGSYYFIQDVATMKESFADCLGGLLSTVAQNIHLRIQALPGFSVARVMSSMPVKTDGDISTVSMRDVYSSETRDVLVKLKMSTPQQVGPKAPMVTFTVQYDSLLSGKTETTNALCAIDTSDKKYEGDPHPKIDEQRTRIEATEALDAARKLAEAGNLGAARECLFARKAEMKMKCKAQSAYVSAMMDDLDGLEGQMQDECTWETSGSKAAAAMQSCHAQQRMNRVGESEGLACYDNSFKKEMRCKSRKS